MVAHESDDLTARELGGMGAGIIGGGLFGVKMGFAAFSYLAPIPVIGPALGVVALVGAPLMGCLMGADVGKKNPMAGFLSLGLGIPGAITDTTAMTDVTPPGSTTTG